MAKMTKAQAKRRLQEAINKVKAVYMHNPGSYNAVTTADMAALEKILDKIMKRLHG